MNGICNGSAVSFFSIFCKFCARNPTWGFSRNKRVMWQQPTLNWTESAKLWKDSWVFQKIRVKMLCVLKNINAGTCKQIFRIWT
jgi:hypothetical protein